MEIDGGIAELAFREAYQKYPRFESYAPRLIARKLYQGSALMLEYAEAPPRDDPDAWEISERCRESVQAVGWDTVGFPAAGSRLRRMGASFASVRFFSALREVVEKARCTFEIVAHRRSTMRFFAKMRHNLLGLAGCRVSVFSFQKSRRRDSLCAAIPSDFILRRGWPAPNWLACGFVPCC